MNDDSRDFKYLKSYINEELYKKQDKKSVIYLVFIIIMLALVNISLYGMFMEEVSNKTENRYRATQAEIDFNIRDNRIDELEDNLEDLRKKLYDTRIELNNHLKEHNKNN